MTKMRRSITKRILSILLTAILLTGMMPIGVFAESISSGATNETVKYTFIADGGLIKESDKSLALRETAKAPTVFAITFDESNTANVDTGIATFTADSFSSVNSNVSTFSLEENAIEYYGRSALEAMSNSTALLYAYDKITAGIGASEAEISVYNGTNAITEAEIKTVLDAYRRDHTEHFWIGNSYFISQTTATVISLLPTYIMSGTELETAKKTFDDAVDEMLSGITSVMSEYEIEKLLHDRLAAKITYVETSNAHNAYGAIVEGKAVCEGYAEAYQYLLQRAGLQSFIATGATNPATGTSEGHAWNIVRIGGKYYHVDLTWDDQGEYLFYAYFNKTDTRIKEDHVITETAYALPVCNSEAADYFTVNGGKMATFDAATVGTMLKNNGLTARVYVTGDKTAFIEAFKTNIRTVATQAGVSGKFSYGYASLGREYILTILSLGGYTVSGTATGFCNDIDDVTIQLIKSGTANVAYKTTVKGKSASYSITGVAAGTYTMKVMKQNHVTREYIVTVGSSNVTQDVTVYPMGDVNGDGAVDILDLIRLKMINTKTAVAENGTSADINGDGSEDAIDLVDLRKKLLGFVV